VLRELFEALAMILLLLAECLARTVLSERMTTGLHVTQTKTGLSRPAVVGGDCYYALPTI